MVVLIIANYLNEILNNKNKFFRKSYGVMAVGRKWGEGVPTGS